MLNGKLLSHTSLKSTLGVRQGSVLHPQLFAVYINDTVSHLPISQRCFIVLYADDILIIAPSVSTLQYLVNSCELELSYLDMIIILRSHVACELVHVIMFSV